MNVKIAEPMLASKATSMASHIPDIKSVEILKIAARSKDVTVRVAAAAGSRNLKIPSVREVLDLLKDDEDEGVRSIARKSIELGYGHIGQES